MECYSAIKKNKIVPFAATWMGLEGTVLSEMNNFLYVSIELGASLMNILIVKIQDVPVLMWKTEQKNKISK